MPQLLIVAHGQPSDPMPAAKALQLLTAQVGAHLPGWHLGAATLAEAGALAREGARLGGGLVFPMFMARGWFTRVAIPERLTQAGLKGWQMLDPFGVAGATQDLAVRLARDCGATKLILAAHGSFKSAAPAQIAEAVAARIRAETDIERVATGFIDQSPQLSGLTGFGPGSACLPFFAMAGGHVSEDLPRALQAAGFAGQILPALGLHPEVPALIARLVRAAALSSQPNSAPN